MSTLRDFIASRKAEIRQQISALRREIDELERAEVAISEEGGSQSPRTGDAPQPAKGTIKDMILQVLEDQGNGAESAEIIDMIKARFDVEVPRTSMSPQLSRLKANGLVGVVGKRWILPKHINYQTDNE
ncbi:hypothetical protein [Thalassobaculum litoreum]|uniref:hypothetical protein n=1 Tax=Thalassobaculum litoreum TaxID=420996 RepID=UPI000B81E680|nr:hypothetical protein [Thalassobaculum litoreum]